METSPLDLGLATVLPVVRQNKYELWISICICNCCLGIRLFSDLTGHLSSIVAGYSTLKLVLDTMHQFILSGSTYPTTLPYKKMPKSLTSFGI